MCCLKDALHYRRKTSTWEITCFRTVSLNCCYIQGYNAVNDKEFLWTLLSDEYGMWAYNTVNALWWYVVNCTTRTTVWGAHEAHCIFCKTLRINTLYHFNNYILTSQTNENYWLKVWLNINIQPIPMSQK